MKLLHKQYTTYSVVTERLAMHLQCRAKSSNEILLAVDQDREHPKRICENECCDELTGITRPRFCASFNSASQSGFVISVFMFPTAYRAYLARVIETFSRLRSARNPILHVEFERTQDTIITSFSRPWKPSTVPTSIVSSFRHLCLKRSAISDLWLWYGVMIPMFCDAFSGDISVDRWLHSCTMNSASSGLTDDVLDGLDFSCVNCKSKIEYGHDGKCDRFFVVLGSVLRRPR